MRIALDMRCVFEGMGGIGRYALSILKELSSIDQKNEYVCYFTHLALPEPIRLNERFTLRIFEAGMIDERFDQLTLPTLLEEDRIDVYHNPTFSVPLIKTRARTIATVHDVVFRRHPHLVEERLRGYLDAATRRSCAGGSAIITVSHFSKGEIALLYPASAGKITVIHNGVSTPPNPPAAPEALQRLGLQAGSYVLYVGAIEKKKNIDLLLEALAQLEKTKLVLAGPQTPGAYPLAEKIRKLGLSERVIVAGYVSPEALETLYRGAQIFVYPSLYEGFGFPPLEAMARGISTIVSDASSLPEIVGDAAVKVDPSRPEALARAIKDLLTNTPLRQELARRGPLRAAEYSWRRSAEQHLRLYETVGQAA